MAKKTTDELFTHLDKYKDALVIIGDRAIKNQKEIDFDVFNNKTLRRNPNRFWEYYHENVMDETEDLTDAQKSVVVLKNKQYVKDVVNLTYDSKLGMLGENIINLHGRDDEFKCTACQITYPYPAIKDLAYDNIKCEICGKPLRPNVLFNKENYNDDKYHKFKELLLETHTVFAVGVDYNEAPILNLIKDYIEMKETKNLQDENEQRMVVLVDIEEDFEEEIAESEFIVHGDPNESMKRLVALIK